MNIAVQVGRSAWLHSLRTATKALRSLRNAANAVNAATARRNGGEQNRRAAGVCCDTTLRLFTPQQLKTSFAALY